MSVLIVAVETVLNIACSFFFFKQKPADEMRISDWSSDVCSSDLHLVYVGDARDAVAVGLAPDRLALRLDAGHRVEHRDRAVQDTQAALHLEIGRASCRERVCQYVKNSVVAVA